MGWKCFTACNRKINHEAKGYANNDVFFFFFLIHRVKRDLLRRDKGQTVLKIRDKFVLLDYTPWRAGIAGHYTRAQRIEMYWRMYVACAYPYHIDAWIPEHWCVGTFPITLLILHTPQYLNIVTKYKLSFASAFCARCARTFRAVTIFRTFISLLAWLSYFLSK